MKRFLALIALLLTFTNAKAQWSDAYNLSMSLAGGGTDVTNIATWTLAVNSSGGISIVWPGTNGSSGQVLTNNGSGTLSWSTPLDGSTFPLLLPATAGRNTIQAANNTALDLILEQFGSSTAHLLDIRNSSNSSIAHIAYDGSFVTTASVQTPAIVLNSVSTYGAIVSNNSGQLSVASANTSGYVLTDQGTGAAPIFAAPATPTGFVKTNPAASSDNVVTGSSSIVPLTAKINGIASNVSQGVVLSNTTASLVGSKEQNPPSLVMQGHAWDDTHAIDSTIGIQLRTRAIHATGQPYAMLRAEAGNIPADNFGYLFYVKGRPLSSTTGDGLTDFAPDTFNIGRTANAGITLGNTAPTINHILISDGVSYKDGTIGGGGGFVDPMTTAGDMIYRNSTVATRLAVGSAYDVMQIDHVSGFPSWGPLKLNLSVTGTLAIANGGTGSTTRTWPLLTPTASSDNYIQQSSSGAVSVTIQQKSSASDNLLDIRKSDGTLLSAIQSDGSIAILGAGLMLVDPSSLSSITIKQPSLSSNFTYTLPSAYPVSAGQVLASTTTGGLSWASAGSSGTVTSITFNNGLTASPNPVTTTGTASINTGYSNTWTVFQDIRKDGIAATTQDGLVLDNTTASTSGVPKQVTPSLTFGGTVWNTTATAATNSFVFTNWLDLTSAAAPTGTLTWDFINTTVDGTTRTNAMTLKSAGVNVGATLTLPLSGIAATATDALVIDNRTPATLGVPRQISGQLKFRGAAYNSSGAASETNYFSMYANQTNAAGATTEQLIINRSLNSGSDIEVARITNTGVISATTGFQVNLGATSGNYLRGNGTNFVSAPISASDISTGTLAVANGGTGSGSPSTNGILRNEGGSTGYGTLALGTTGHFSGALSVSNGGTGLSTFTTAGKIPYSTGATTMAALANPGSTWSLMYYDATNNKPAWASGVYMESGLANLNMDGTNLKFISSGQGTKIDLYTGTSDAIIGTATLSSGSVTVSTSAVTSTCIIFLTYSGTAANKGFLDVENIVGSTSFDIKSTNASDGNSVNWIIFESH